MSGRELYEIFEASGRDLVPLWDHLTQSERDRWTLTAGEATERIESAFEDQP